VQIPEFLRWDWIKGPFLLAFIIYGFILFSFTRFYASGGGCPDWLNYLYYPVYPLIYLVSYSEWGEIWYLFWGGLALMLAAYWLAICLIALGIKKL